MDSNHRPRVPKTCKRFSQPKLTACSRSALPYGVVSASEHVCKSVKPNLMMLTLERFSISGTYSDSVLTLLRVATLESWVLQRVTARQTGAYKSGPARHTSLLSPL